MELAHIAMGHHIDTRYAFNDRLLFPDESTFQRINMNHSDVDNEPRQEGDGVSGGSMYKDRLANAGLLLRAVGGSGQVLKALNTPKLGDSLLKADGTPWMADLEHMAPKLNWDDLAQTPALPLGSWLKTDPWDDKVHMLSAKRYAPMNARDKMPFEVTPIFYKLQHYEEAISSPSFQPMRRLCLRPLRAPSVFPPALSARWLSLITTDWASRIHQPQPVIWPRRLRRCPFQPLGASGSRRPLAALQPVLSARFYDGQRREAPT
jgi:hypothetical protein